MKTSLTKYSALLVSGLLIFASGPLMAADVAASMLTIEKFSAERGDANSQYFMGEHYELGDSGVSQDQRIALDWYKKAAAQGHAAAMYKLGTFHEKGLGGLPADMSKATEWYRQAAEGGSNQAIQRIAALNKTAREEEQQKQRQLEQEQKAKAEDEARREQQKRQQTEMRLKVELEKKRALEQEREEATRLAALKAAESKSEPKVTKKPSYDVSQLISEIMNREWRAEGRAAEFLPTSDTGCLKTNETEVTCFSQERSRSVAGKKVTYALKAVLRDFKENGAFDVNYIYNVIELKDAAGKGDATDRYGLLPKDGWQQPGVDVRCELNGSKQIQCSGSKVKQVVFEAL